MTVTPLHHSDTDQALEQESSAIFRQRIMVVDDTPANLLAMRVLLKKINNEIDIDEASSGNEALSLALEHHYSLILLDVQMPEMDGYEVAEALHNYHNTSHIPIIFVTAIFRDEQHRLDGYSVGAVDYIEKPINEEILLSKVKVFLELDRQKLELKYMNRCLEEKNHELKQEVIQRISAQNELQTLSEAVEQSPVSVAITDNQGQIIFINSQFEKVSGYYLKDVLEKTLFETLYASHEAFNVIWESLNTENSWRGELLATMKNGTQVWQYVTASRMNNSDNNVRYLYMAEDISLRKEYEAQLIKQSQFDEITELPNRILVQDRMIQLMESASRRSHYVIVLLLDLDDFKTINETLGIDTGNKLLKLVANRLQETLRDSDTVARLGGDEFLVVMENSASKTGGDIAAEKLLASLESPFNIADREVFLTASVGICYGPENDYGPQEFILNAEAAMYRAKQQGRNSYAFYSAELNMQSKVRLNIESHLRKALEHSEFEVHFQPQICSRSIKPIAAEALLRWTNSDLGAVSPAEFIPITEAIGLIHDIGSWVLENALQSAAKWRQLTGEPLRVAVNASSCQFEREAFLNQIDSLLQLSGYDPSMLEIEITESLLLDSDQNTLDSLERLKGMGVNIAIDDFGTGYSSLSYLKKFPISTVKIDQSFIRHIEQGQTDATLVKAIIAMAHGLGMEVVAEGVETEGQKTFLLNHGCDIFQGYLFSKPMPHSAFMDYLENV